MVPRDAQAGQITLLDDESSSDTLIEIKVSTRFDANQGHILGAVLTTWAKHPDIPREAAGTKWR
jgi:hypothetical protein